MQTEGFLLHINAYIYLESLVNSNKGNYLSNVQLVVSDGLHNSPKNGRLPEINCKNCTLLQFENSGMFITFHVKAEFKQRSKNS